MCFTINQLNNLNNGYEAEIKYKYKNKYKLNYTWKNFFENVALATNWNKISLSTKITTT